MKRTVIAACSAVALLGGCDSVPPISKAIAGNWDCDSYQLTFADDGRYTITSLVTQNKDRYTGIYKVVEAEGEKPAAIETAPSAHPLSTYKYIRSAPSKILD